MSPEAQRIAIAEACGWKGPKHPDTLASMQGWWSQKRGVWWLDPFGKHQMASSVPNYLVDLSAMYEAEAVLADEALCSRYAEWLALICKGRAYDPFIGVAGYIWHATAAQRAEAFLRTIGKWEDAT